MTKYITEEYIMVLEVFRSYNKFLKRIWRSKCQRGLVEYQSIGSFHLCSVQKIMSTSVRKRNIAEEKENISIYSKVFTPESTWKDKDEFLDVIYWLRQIIGVILGIVWGILPLKGFIGLALFLIINVAVVYLYYSSFHKIDEEEYGGTSEILKEGLMTSFSSFLVAWIIFYSALHADS